MMHPLKVPPILVQPQIYTQYPFFTRKVLAIKLWQYEPVYLFAFEVFLSVASHCDTKTQRYGEYHHSQQSSCSKLKTFCLNFSLLYEDSNE